MMKTFYIGIKAIIVHNNKALVLERKVDGRHFWDLPGGRMDEGEEILQTLARELKEEIGVEDFSNPQLISAYRLPRNLKDGNGLMLLIHSVDVENPHITLSDEHVSYRWVSREELPSLSSTKDMYIDEGFLKALEIVLT